MKQRSSEARVFLDSHGWQRVDASSSPRVSPKKSRRRLILGLALLLALVAAIAFSTRLGKPTEGLRAPAAAPVEERWGLSPFTAGGLAPAQAQATAQADGAAGRPAPPSPVPLVSEWDVDFKGAGSRFDELRWFGDDPARLEQQARLAEDRLPTLLAQGTIGADDALLLKTGLLEVLDSDAKRRGQLLIAWWSEHPLPRPSENLAAYRRVEALRREEALVLDWAGNATPDPSSSRPSDTRHRRVASRFLRSHRRPRAASASLRYARPRGTPLLPARSGPRAFDEDTPAAGRGSASTRIRSASWVAHWIYGWGAR